jgi:hypothetical protein
LARPRKRNLVGFMLPVTEWALAMHEQTRSLNTLIQGDRFLGPPGDMSSVLDRPPKNLAPRTSAVVHLDGRVSGAAHHDRRLLGRREPGLWGGFSEVRSSGSMLCNSRGLELLFGGLAKSLKGPLWGGWGGVVTSGEEPDPHLPMCAWMGMGQSVRKSDCPGGGSNRVLDLPRFSNPEATGRTGASPHDVLPSPCWGHV